jgi:flagellar basal-body rod protein FlgF
MDSAGYTTLTRQSGLMREMQIIANNIANANTTGFRQQGLIFSEYIQRAGGDASVSMAAARVRNTSFMPGTLQSTGSQFDFAIEGEGFFLVETPEGERLTRAGAFTPSAEGTLVTPDGYPVLDAGGAPIFVPPGTTEMNVARDGTISSGGQPIGRLGLVSPLDPQAMSREGAALFRADAGFEEVIEPRIRQGFVEGSNVNPIEQISRMIEVQRAYEMGQTFLQREDDRVRAALKAFVK